MASPVSTSPRAEAFVKSALQFRKHGFASRHFYRRVETVLICVSATSDSSNDGSRFLRTLSLTNQPCTCESMPARSTRKARLK